MDRKRINEAYTLSQKLAAEIKSLVDETQDYDLQRLLKKVEAQVMDIQHNLKLISRTVSDEE
jgi:hypothetical protein